MITTMRCFVEKLMLALILGSLARLPALAQPTTTLADASVTVTAEFDPPLAGRKFIIAST